FAANRILDVSRKVADTLGFHNSGTTPVRVEYIAAASLAGSDDQKLLATLRSDGPALLDRAGGGERNEIAESGPAVVAWAEVPPFPTQEGRGSSHPASAFAAQFGDNPVPLPPVRPMNLRTIAGQGQPSALRRASLQ
ncbi:MAG: septal ring lytic transglycosylase RlpA family protein, partial [Beijerinckiaceae bacterium]|nr:septal ring lytic transglycosylase RlpA family protein [Beijerinckiaceae bacterium]